MRFALPAWEPSDPNCDHPFFGPVGRSPEPAITDLDNAYMAPRERGDRDGGLRKLSKRDEQIICRLIERELLNRKQCAQLFDVSEKTIAMIVYAAGLRFSRKNPLLLHTPALTHSRSNAFRSCLARARQPKKLPA